MAKVLLLDLIFFFFINLYSISINLTNETYKLYQIVYIYNKL